MSSKAQTTANRQNALKSTGPRTARGKTKSKLNAVKSGIYAKTPILPGEDESAYRELEKSNLDYFAPIGPVENLLVHQITAEHLKLGRIERADVALFEQLQEAQQTRFIRSLSNKGLDYALFLLDPNGEEKKRRDSHEAAAGDAAMKHKQYSGAAEIEADLNPADKKSIEARIRHFADLGSTILEGLVPGTESSPQECLDRQRRTTMRVYLSYVAQLMELQEARLTVTLPPQPQPTTTPQKRTDVKGPQQVSVEEAANQNHLKPDNDIPGKLTKHASGSPET